MKWYFKVLENYVNFEGRARRKEYWMFVLFNMIFGTSAMVLDNVTGLAFKSIGYGPIYGIYLLAVILPSIAVGVRRLHDIGKSGGYYFIILIPIIGAIWFFVLMVTEGDAGVNEFGENPKNQN